MDRMKTARNVAIIALIAAAVEFLPGGGRAADAFAAALWVVFAAGFAFFGYRLYRERGVDLHSLGDRHRALLYGAVAVGYVTVAARSRMWQTLVRRVRLVRADRYSRLYAAGRLPLLPYLLSSLAEQRRVLPDKPGVYLFRDAKGRVIYVGKAKSIRKRVASHFSKAQVPSSPGHAEMVASVEAIECVVVSSEAEALLAEQSFIKQYRPRFNIRLRDDKSYPFIAISLDEQYPRVYFTRERHRSGRAYFGPYSSAKRVRSTLEVLAKVFMYRSCTGPEPGRRSGSPCLDYYIKRCEAPCVGYVTKEDYRRSIDGVIDFLSGRFTTIERDLEQRMRSASAAQDYEQATLERNRLRAVRSLMERQRVAKQSIGTLRRRCRSRRRARRQRPGLPGARRHPLRPSLLLPVQRDRARAGGGGRGVPAAVLRRPHHDPSAARGSAGAWRAAGAGRSPLAASWWPG